MNNSSHWAQIQEFSLLWGIRLLFAVYRHCGRNALQLLLYPVVSYYWLINGAARRASRDYLRRIAASSPNNPVHDTCLYSYRHFISFANAIIDKLAAWAGTLPLSDMHYEGRETLQTDLQQGRGALLFASHLGNVEICRMIAAQDPNIKINVLVHTRHAETFNQLLQLYNPASSLNLLQVSEINAATAMFLAEKIDGGELVIIAADRTPVSNNQRVVAVDFLGSPALFPQGPFILAGLLQCPVYCLFCLKLADNRFQVIFEPFSENLTLPRGRREQIIAQTAQHYAERLQHYCLKQPLQWFNFYDFWQMPTQQ